MRELREQQGVSQETLAREIGVSRQAVIWWEGGKSLPNPTNLQKLAKFFGLSLEEMLDTFKGGNTNE